MTFHVGFSIKRSLPRDAAVKSLPPSCSARHCSPFCAVGYPRRAACAGSRRAASWDSSADPLLLGWANLAFWPGCPFGPVGPQEDPRGVPPGGSLGDPPPGIPEGDPPEVSPGGSPRGNLLVDPPGGYPGASLRGITQGDPPRGSGESPRGSPRGSPGGSPRSLARCFCCQSEPSSCPVRRFSPFLCCWLPPPRRLRGVPGVGGDSRPKSENQKAGLIVKESRGTAALFALLRGDSPYQTCWAPQCYSWGWYP